MKLSIVPQERRFYALFTEQGKLVEDTLVELGKSLLEGRSRHPRMRDLEHRCDEVTHEIYQLINRSFVTPLEREDIYNLAATLDDIVDLAEEAADKMELYGVKEVPAPARQVGEVLAAAGHQLAEALAGLDGFRELEAHRIEIHRLENEADHINREALRDLFAEDRPAGELIKWKDIYDLLEATADKCEQTANLLEAISIKNA